ncbi:doublesex- and mab-3-related transcription factor B1-like [Toxotes jaculatrix]|uniref:doublesex- and mab-3-related transcription factor B1-like n=1 Tax=Toxotes jaculatrix TaxID=941984 RepID=UPI001B3AE2E6|nr:doublesex- and mab-3-related transcription factor B1-like [Toxotes jaculatrix]XP_040912056.1 doublesex- and mab-3-related transcription factor B1-like [Toxotes jaculatrix]
MGSVEPLITMSSERGRGSGDHSPASTLMLSRTESDYRVTSEEEPPPFVPPPLHSPPPPPRPSPPPAPRPLHLEDENYFADDESEEP